MATYTLPAIRLSASASSPGGTLGFTMADGARTISYRLDSAPDELFPEAVPVPPLDDILGVSFGGRSYDVDDEFTIVIADVTWTNGTTTTVLGMAPTNSDSVAYIARLSGADIPSIPGLAGLAAAQITTASAPFAPGQIIDLSTIPGALVDGVPTDPGTPVLPIFPVFPPGGQEGDRIVGTDGDDTYLPSWITGGAPIDRRLVGTDLPESISGLAGGDSIEAEGGDDTIFGGPGTDFIDGDNGDDSIEGGADGDIIYGDRGDDTVNGGGGSDMIDIAGGYGNDIIDGGSGFDTIQIDSLLDGFAGRIDLSAGTFDLGPEPGGGTFRSIEMIDLAIFEPTTGSLTITGSGLEVQSNSSVPFTLRYYGGAGNDVFTSASGADHGTDMIFGGAGNDTIGGSGLLGGGADDDVITGSAGADSLFGAGGNDTLSGGDGNDLIGGATGEDVIDGGSGADQIWTSAGNDTALGDAGDDEIGGAGGDDSLDGGAGDDVLWGAGDNDILIGGADNDLLGGFTGNDMLHGGAGLDTLWGATGDDVLNGDGDADQLGGGTGNDSVDGGGGNDMLFGGLDNDTVLGGAGDDTLYGAAGDDVLGGGAGDDLLFVGTGADVVQFGAGDGADEIRFFSLAEDRIELDNALWTGELTEGQIVAQFGATVDDDYVLEFDGGETLTLSQRGGATGLEDVIDIV